MKKWLIGICIALVLLFLAGSYYFIPKNLLISANTTVGSNNQGLYRLLSNPDSWKDWWPANRAEINTDSVYRFNEYDFKLTDIGYNALRITTILNQNIDTTTLHMIPVGDDSSKLVWDAVVYTGSNPFTKINGYRKAKKLRHTLSMILDTLQLFASSSKGIYGLDIKKEPVKREYVVSTKKVFPYYPGTEAIYEMINNIKTYISQTVAKEEDYPMLNITTLDSGQYLAQVGVPIDREIPQKDNFFLKRLLKDGNILVAETKGGRNACDSAMKAMEMFAHDHKHFSIALPFLSLVTDRTKEKDSTKWVTKIYYPTN